MRDDSTGSTSAPENNAGNVPDFAAMREADEAAMRKTLGDARKVMEMNTSQEHHTVPYPGAYVPDGARSDAEKPVRFCQNCGAKVEWDGEKELVTITSKNLKTDENVTILITIGAATAKVNGKEIKLDSPAFIENDRTYTPIRFISEKLGASVEWVEKEQKVIITKPEIKKAEVK